MSLGVPFNTTSVTCLLNIEAKRMPLYHSIIQGVLKIMPLALIYGAVDTFTIYRDGDDKFAYFYKTNASRAKTTLSSTPMCDPIKS